jgi:hypothetical protein
VSLWKVRPWCCFPNPEVADDPNPPTFLILALLLLPTLPLSLGIIVPLLHRCDIYTPHLVF